MGIDSVKKYLASSLQTPYFLFISDSQYATTKDELSFLGLDFVRMSRFCNDDDKIPDIDGLFNYINVAEKNCVIVGLGEFLALCGDDEASRTLSRLKDHNVGKAKVVLLLRGLSSLITAMKTDPRFDRRRFSVIDKAECDLSFTFTAPSVGLSGLPGLKAMLMELENGKHGKVAVNTIINFDNSIFPIHKITSAYEGIKASMGNFPLASTCGTDAHWAQLLAELNQNDDSLDTVFEKNGFSGYPESNFYNRIAGSDYSNWLYFIYLKSKADALQNGYLRFVLDKTSRFKDFARNVLNAIIDIPHTDKQFPSFYRERKALVEKFPESDIADFVVNNRKGGSESIYKLTDNTMVEREEIIAWLAQNEVFFSQLDDYYPVLADYLKKYIFKCSELADLLTDYFEAYKRQKLFNKLEPEFLKQVNELACLRKYNRLPTRNEILDGLDKIDTYLHWLDALGVEYLALIESLAQKHGLSVRVHIARAELPTITSLNRDFYDAWEGPKEKNEELDDVKHHDRGGYNFTNNELPVHLAKELDIITAMINKAATELAKRHYKCFLIVSDHGASRLAVLRRKEEKYETDTTGKYSGRCCKLFEPYDLPFAAEENGYLVLADYGRFKGSRAANVEVHGGASLEEVVVPIIELSLKDGSVTVKLVDETVTVDFRAGTEIKLFFNSPVQNVSVILNEKRYSASQIDANHYSVKLPDTKRAGSYSADVYVGDNLIGQIIIKAQGKSGKVNDAFDNLF